MSTGKRKALLIGARTYTHNHGPESLPYVLKDVEKLNQLFSDKNRGGFDEVTQLLDPTKVEMEKEIRKFFISSSRDDMLLLYFSGHGQSDKSRKKLYLMASDSDTENLSTTAVKSTFIHDEIIEYSSVLRKLIIILDCCCSHAFVEGLSVKSSVERLENYQDKAKELNQSILPDQSNGKGIFQEQKIARIVVLTACRSDQKAQRSSKDSQLSAFTYYLVDGIETGKADENHDGLIDVQEIYSYILRGLETDHPGSNGMLPGIDLRGGGLNIKISNVHLSPQEKFKKAISMYAECTGPGMAPALLEIVKRQKAKELGLAPEEINEIHIPSVETSSVSDTKAENLHEFLAEKPTQKDIKAYLKVFPQSSQLDVKKIQNDNWKSHLIALKEQRRYQIGAGVCVLSLVGSIAWVSYQKFEEPNLNSLSSTKNAYKQKEWDNCISHSRKVPKNSRYSQEAKKYLSECEIGKHPQQFLLAQSGNSPIQAISISPNNQSALIASSMGSPELWDLRSREKTATFSNQRTYLKSALINLADDRMMLVKEAEKIKIRDLKTGQNIDIYRSDSSDSDEITEDSLAAISRNGKILVLVTQNRVRVIEFDFTTLRAKERQIQIRSSILLQPSSVALNEDGTIIVLGGSSEAQSTKPNNPEEGSNLPGAIEIWNSTTGNMISRLDSHAGQITSLAISHNGKKMVSACSAGEIRVWDLNNLQRPSIYLNEKNEKAPISSVAIDASGELVASSDSSARVVNVWRLGIDPLTPRRLDTKINQSTQPVPMYALTFSKDGKTLIGGGSDGRVIMWRWNNQTLF